MTFASCPGVFSSTLHLKYPSEDQIEELVGSQFVARQCLVATIMHQLEAGSLAFANRVYNSQGL